ncbi:MAG: Slp/YeaY family lipoprotein [Gammaproteobacteria bacterium]|nr:Slp/YeaY family lipoprotein [Gammaproteobacteria bacterium]
MFLKSITYLGGFAAIVLVSACSSHIPREIKQPLDSSPGVAQVRHQTDAYLSQKVRWGGVILNTENKQNASELMILAMPLSENGKPQNSDQSPGRFIAIIDEFVEPQVYSPKREITVTGQILRAETLKVGEFSYEYPVIQVEHHYLWPPEPEQSYVDYPPYLWYDPFYPYPWYDPFYPWPYPYYYPHHRHRY